MSSPLSTSTAGYGQQDPTVGNDDFNFIAFLVKQRVMRMETNRLVQVKAIHAGTGTPPGGGTVDVLPLVQQIDGGGNLKSHGTVFGIPVFRLQGAFGAVVLDPKVGDIGYVAVCNRDISIIKSTKKEGGPGSGRSFSLSDGIYIGGLLNDAPDQYVWFEDGKVTVADKNGNKIVLDSAGITATDKFGHVLRMQASGFDLTGDLVVHGTITGTTDVIAGAVSTKLHIHSGVQTGGGTSGPPVP